MSSSRRSYGTPDGHAVTQAMQPRQRSQWSAIASEIASVSLRAASMRTIRPRGESISSPQSTYVGQVGRQKPQWTHVSRSACARGPERVERGHQMPPTKIPGAQTPAGSKRSFTRRESAISAASSTPHGSARSSAGASCRTPGNGNSNAESDLIQ